MYLSGFFKKVLIITESLVVDTMYTLLNYIEVKTLLIIHITPLHYPTQLRSTDNKLNKIMRVDDTHDQITLL